MNCREASFGNTGEFAVAVAFVPDPDQGHGATPEESISWGSLIIWVKGQNLCEHIEHERIISSVNWYLLPFLEWLAQHWDPLLHEQKFPIAHSDAKDMAWASFQSNGQPPIGYDDQQALEWDRNWQDWLARHSLLMARSGGLFPDVFIRRYLDQIEISWGEISCPGAPQGFRFCVPDGFARVDPALVAQPLYELLHHCSQYLQQRCANSERIAALVRAIQSIPRTDQTARLAWLAGLHLDIGNAIDRWQHLARKVSSLLGDTGNRLFTGSPTHHDIVITGSCDAAMMFGSLSPNIGEDDVLAIAGKMIESADSVPDHAILEQLSMPVPLDDDPSPSWEQGYKLAMVFAEKIDRIQNRYCIDVAAVLEYLGIHRGEIALSDSDIRAISLAGPRHKPTLLLNTSNPTNQFDSGRRFTFAHELCHILYDRSYGRQLAMASGPWAPRDIERRANAFAAMFIMPIHLIREVFGSLTSPGVTIENIYEMADRLKASVVGVIDHLKNLGYIDNNTQDRLKEEAVKSYRLSEKYTASGNNLRLLNPHPGPPPLGEGA